jgi:hypothetical protein
MQVLIIKVFNCCGTLQFEQTMAVKVFYINFGSSELSALGVD